MSNVMDAKNIINGTWGQVWMDSDRVSEAYGLAAKVTNQKVAVNICGKLAEDTKTTGIQCKGTLKLHKVSSRMIIKISDNLKNGKETTAVLISALADPDAYGFERLCIKDAKFDELTLTDWEAKKNGEESIPFTFTDWEFLDKITPQ
ncbi:phage tail tube protein [Clostridium estertheticum]|uniref:phage tail tube protein n=1 Tax=Clostridium estertheticum TaxID=238834 RepID=UPI001CCE31C9|nr:phage tail tube protein [Clostridium estertheticum]MBZ9615295.1 phage tail tube protein [Clostridium estertheticum subsp. laramiense]WAG75184.1 phage tail tube protein [Clostridium estertheticum]